MGTARRGRHAVPDLAEALPRLGKPGQRPYRRPLARWPAGRAGAGRAATVTESVSA
ncbi:MAG: hypothetical protein ACJ73S_33100 [Mycobacteriales bacterium]